LHTWQYVFIWAKLESDLLAEIGSGIGADGVVDVEKIDGGSAQAIREIVKEAWEISARYLIVRPRLRPSGGISWRTRSGSSSAIPCGCTRGSFCWGSGPAELIVVNCIESLSVLPDASNIIDLSLQCKILR
jgi:hypothetical protein